MSSAGLGVGGESAVRGAGMGFVDGVGGWESEGVGQFDLSERPLVRVVKVGGGEEVGAELIPLNEFLPELLNSFHKISLSVNCSKASNIGLFIFLLFLLLLLGLFLMMGQPFGEKLVLELVAEDDFLDGFPELRNPLFVFFVEFNPEVGLLLLVVEVECHPVEVKALPRSQVYIEFLLLEGPPYSLWPLQLLVADFYQQPYHLPDLMVDETLPNQGEANKRQSLILLLLVPFDFGECSLDGLPFDQICLHAGDEAVATRVVGLEALGEVVEAVSAEVELGQLADPIQQLVLLELVETPPILEQFLRVEEVDGGNVVVDAGAGVVAHVEALSYFFGGQDADVRGKVGVDVDLELAEVDDPGLLGKEVPVVQLQAAGNTVAEGVHLLVGAAGSGPLDALEVVHVGFEDKAVVAEDLVQDILDGVLGVSLVLQALEAAAVVAQEEGHLRLHCLQLLHPLLITIIIAQQSCPSLIIEGSLLTGSCSRGRTTTRATA